MRDEKAGADKEAGKISLSRRNHQCFGNPSLFATL
jgi:hypothetical protein